VLRLMAQEMDTKDIAGNLNIGVKTVETYQSRMKKKLNIFNLVGLTKYALRQGLVLLNEPPRKE
jgi:DNA-binding CsgD family transcriptional regulator